MSIHITQITFNIINYNSCIEVYYICTQFNGHNTRNKAYPSLNTVPVVFYVFFPVVSNTASEITVSGHGMNSRVYKRITETGKK